MDSSSLASDPARALAWLAGGREGFITVARFPGRGLECMLCGGPVKPQAILDHGMAHLAAATVPLNAMLVLISLVASERGVEHFGEGDRWHRQRTIFDEAVEQVFGFRPGSPEALQFWQEHGGT